MPRKAVSKDTVPMMDVSKDTTNQAMSKMIVKLTNYKEETTASTKPESANEEPRPSLLCIGFNNKTKVLLCCFNCEGDRTCPGVPFKS
jgi:hypothetical protein